jgi:hypothetical protein
MPYSAVNEKFTCLFYFFMAFFSSWLAMLGGGYFFIEDVISVSHEPSSLSTAGLLRASTSFKPSNLPSYLLYQELVLW